MRKKSNYLHVKDILIYECELYLKQPLTPHQRKIIDAYRTLDMDLPLKLDGGWLSLYLDIIDNATFSLIMYLKIRHTFVLEISFNQCRTPLEISFNQYMRM